MNAGLWGLTIGGDEMHGSRAPLPEEAWQWTRGAGPGRTGTRRLQVDFERGIPVALDGRRLDPVELIEKLNREAGALGAGRGYHLGDTVLGIKGRIAFEAPAAEVLLGAHRELEKLVLTEDQRFWKDHLGDVYGRRLHQGLFHDPFQRDIEALLRLVAGARHRPRARAALRRGGLGRGRRIALQPDGRERRAATARRVAKGADRDAGLGLARALAEPGRLHRRARTSPSRSRSSEALLPRQDRLGDDAPRPRPQRRPRRRRSRPRPGTVIAVRVLNAKTTYDTLEDVHGRMVKLYPGDVIAGALGHRDALYGYSGRVPETVAVGDELQLLNLGGVCGSGAVRSPANGEPFRLEVLGSVLEFPYIDTRVGVPANIDARGPAERAAGARRRAAADRDPGRHLHGRRQDHGRRRPDPRARLPRAARRRRQADRRLAAPRRARHAATAAPIRWRSSPTSAWSRPTSRTRSPRPTAWSAHLAESAPDLFVLEMGDGLLGTYGVRCAARRPGPARGRALRRALRPGPGRRLGRRAPARGPPRPGRRRGLRARHRHARRHALLPRRARPAGLERAADARELGAAVVASLGEALPASARAAAPPPAAEVTR